MRENATQTRKLGPSAETISSCAIPQGPSTESKVSSYYGDRAAYSVQSVTSRIAKQQQAIERMYPGFSDLYKEELSLILYSYNTVSQTNSSWSRRGNFGVIFPGEMIPERGENRDYIGLLLTFCVSARADIEKLIVCTIN